MSDETFSPEPRRSRAPLIVGGIAFLGGIGFTAAVLQLGGGHLPFTAPKETPPVTATAHEPAPATPAAMLPSADLATLNAREAELAAKLDQLALRVRDVDGSARSASGYATRAERMMIAFAARRAIERGQPLGPLGGQLRDRFGERHAEAVDTLVRTAAEPVTIEDLRVALDTIGPRLMSDPDDTLWNHARRLIGDLVVLRRADAPSPRPADRLRRARRALDAGQVEAALAEVAHLPGIEAAKSWLAAARRYVAAREALAEIEQAAIEAPAAAPAPAAVAAAPPPAGT